MFVLDWTYAFDVENAPRRAHVASRGDEGVENRQVILILRLVLDSRGRLEYGEAVDSEARLQGRFRGWRGLTRTLRAWLARQEHGNI